MENLLPSVLGLGHGECGGAVGECRCQSLTHWEYRQGSLGTFIMNPSLGDFSFRKVNSLGLTYMLQCLNYSGLIVLYYKALSL